jgi:hypothetical protein
VTVLNLGAHRFWVGGIDEAETLAAVAHPGTEVRKQNPVTFGQPGLEAADVIAGLESTRLVP